MQHYNVMLFTLLGFFYIDASQAFQGVDKQNDSPVDM